MRITKFPNSGHSGKNMTRYDRKNKMGWFAAGNVVPPWEEEVGTSSMFRQVPVCVLATLYLRSQEGWVLSALIVSEKDGLHLELLENITRRESVKWLLYKEPRDAHPYLNIGRLVKSVHRGRRVEAGVPSRTTSQTAGPHSKVEVCEGVGCDVDDEDVSNTAPSMWWASMGMEGDAPAVSAVQTREGAHSEKSSLEAFVTRRDDLRAVRDASWSRFKQGCEGVLERYDHNYEEALEQLRDDIFDVRLDNLDEAYEEALREGKYEHGGDRTLVLGGGRRPGYRVLSVGI